MPPQAATGGRKMSNPPPGGVLRESERMLSLLHTEGALADSTDMKLHSTFNNNAKQVRINNTVTY